MVNFQNWILNLKFIEKIDPEIILLCLAVHAELIAGNCGEEVEE